MCRQPFISLASLTLFLHCPLLTIDLCHSPVVLASVSRSIYSHFPLFFWPWLIFSSSSPTYKYLLKDSFHFTFFPLSHVCVFTLSITHPHTTPEHAHISLNEVNFRSMKSYWPSAEVAHIVRLYWTGHICMPVWLSLWSAWLSCSMSACLQYALHVRLWVMTEVAFIYLSVVNPDFFSLLAYFLGDKLSLLGFLCFRSPVSQQWWFTVMSFYMHLWRSCLNFHGGSLKC